MPVAANFSDKSPRRDLNMVRMTVEAATMQALPNGFLVLPGKSDIVVYEDEVQQVIDLVRDEDENLAIQRAHKEFDRRLKRYAEEKCGGDLERAKKICPESVQSVYCLHNDGRPHIRPLLSAVITEKDIPPPQKKEAWNASKDTAGMMAAAMDAILNNPDLRKMLENKILNELAEKEDKSKAKKN